MHRLKRSMIAAGILLLFVTIAARAQDTEPVIVPFEEVPFVYAVEGFVVDAAGEGIRNATVRVTANVDGVPFQRMLTTDSAGSFSLGDLPETKYWRFAAFHPNYAMPSGKGGRAGAELPRLADAPPIVIRLLEARTYRGTVIDVDGTPAVGARVKCSHDHEQLAADRNTSAEPVAITDEQGNFEFTRLAMEKPGIWIWHEDRPVHNFGSDEMPDDHVYRLTNGLTIVGCVTNERGEHLEGVSLHLPGGNIGGGQGIRYGPWFTSSEEDGTFKFDKLPYFSFFQPHSDKLRYRTASYGVQVDDNRFKEDIFNLYLTRENTLPFAEIVVRDATAPGEAKSTDIGKYYDEGRAAVTVRLAAPVPEDTGNDRAGVRLDELPQSGRFYNDRKFFRGADSVRFDDIPPGEYRIAASVADYAFEPQILTLRAFDDPSVVLKPGPSILKGNIIGLTPVAPRPKIHWYIETEGPGHVQLTGYTTVGTDDTYTITGIIPGTGAVQLNVGSVWFPPDPFELTVGENRHDIVIPHGRIEGRIVDFDPESRLPDRADLTITGSNSVRLELLADNDGNFETDFLPAGTYNVTYRDARKDVTVREEVVITDSGAVYVELRMPEDLGMIAGAVPGIAALESDPRRRLSILARNEENPDDYIYGDIDEKSGVYEIKNVEPGTYVVSVSGKGIRGHRGNVEVQPNSRTLVDIELLELRPVNLRFISSESIRPPRISVEMQNLDDELLRSGVSIGNSIGTSEPNLDWDWDTALPPGDYEISVRFGSGEPIISTVDIPPGDEPLEIRIENQ